MRLVDAVEYAVEYLERAKSEFYDLKLSSEIDENWRLAEALDECVDEVQSVIDKVVDEKMFMELR